jgi:hypothetical protein
MKPLEHYLALHWIPAIDTVTEGEDVYVRLTVPGLIDFAVYGDGVPEVRARWREALTSHLAGYLAVGKVIPEPPVIEVTSEPAGTTTSEAGRNDLGRAPLAAA